MSARSIACGLVVYHGFVGAKDRAQIAERIAKRKGDHAKAQLWAQVKSELEEQMALSGAFDASPIRQPSQPIQYPRNHVSTSVI